MEALRRLYARSRAHRRRLLVGLACAVLASPFSYLSMLLLQALSRQLQQAPALRAQGRLGLIVAEFAIAIPVLALLKAILEYASRYLISHWAQSCLADLRADLYASLVERPVSFLSRYHTAEFVSRVTNDVQRIDLGLSLRVTDVVVSVPQALLLVGLLFWLDARLAVLVLVIVPPGGLLVRRWSHRIKAASRSAQEHVASLSSILDEVLGGIRIVKAYRAEPQEVARFGERNETLRKTTMSAYRTMALSGPVLDVMGALLIAVLIALAAYEIASGRLKFDGFIAFFGSMTALYQSIKRLTAATAELQNTTAAAERCFDLLDEKESEPGGRKDASDLAHGIAFHDASFSYGSAPVLRDLDFTVRAGEVVAIVGESGSGKTTLTNLLPRFRDVTAGSITWDGSDLRELTPSSLRARIALVTQDTVVFDDTVTRNIAYGDPSPDAARVVAAARAAHADAFVRELEQGYATRLGQNGNRLSGGQKQRIAIARAVYKDAPVLILDEATSSLDAQSEALVQDALDRLMAGRTVFVVAHRLSTIRSADRIVVLSEGRISQQGTHDDLVGQDGAYRQLYRLQSGLS